MICDFLQPLPLAQCIGELTIGTISDTSQSVTVYIRDVTTGAENIYQGSSDVNGLVKIDLSGEEFSDLHTYELWITLAGMTPRDRTTITIEGQSSTLICIRFDRVMDGGNQFTFPSATIKI